MFSEKIGCGCVPADFHRAQLAELPAVQIARANLQSQIGSGKIAQHGLKAYRTKLMCTPMFRCTLEQSRHMYTPKVTLDQVGFRALQSKHD